MNKDEFNKLMRCAHSLVCFLCHHWLRQYNPEFLASYMYPIMDNAQMILILLKIQANRVPLVWQLPEPHLHSRGYFLESFINSQVTSHSALYFNWHSPTYFRNTSSIKRSNWRGLLPYGAPSFYDRFSSHFIIMNKGDAHLFSDSRCKTSIPVLPNYTWCTKAIIYFESSFIKTLKKKNY